MQTGTTTTNPSQVPEATVPVSPDGQPLPNAAFDATILRALGRNDPARMRRFVTLFLESADRGMTEIETALATGQTTGLRRAGHRMKSSARAMGLAGFAALCEEMEDHGLAERVDPAQALHRQMGSLLAVVREALLAECETADAEIPSTSPRPAPQPDPKMTP